MINIINFSKKETTKNIRGKKTNIILSIFDKTTVFCNLQKVKNTTKAYHVVLMYSYFRVL